MVLKYPYVDTNNDTNQPQTCTDSNLLDKINEKQLSIAISSAYSFSFLKLQ